MDKANEEFDVLDDDKEKESLKRHVVTLEGEKKKGKHQIIKFEEDMQDLIEMNKNLSAELMIEERVRPR